jgi:hypothetical protein
MTTARAEHTATLLPSGRLLVHGGRAGAAIYDTSEVYNPVSDTFQAPATIPTSAHSRAIHTAVALPNGNVLVAGGLNFGGFHSATCEIFTETPPVWTVAAPMLEARAGHCMVMLPNGLVFVAGGLSNSLIALNSTELYNPALDTWTAGPRMSAGRVALTCTLVAATQSVLVVGGARSATDTAMPIQTAILLGSQDSVEIYHYMDNVWSTAQQLDTTRMQHAAVLNAVGTVVISGGASDNASSPVPTFNGTATGTSSFSSTGTSASTSASTSTGAAASSPTSTGTSSSSRTATATATASSSRTATATGTSPSPVTGIPSLTSSRTATGTAAGGMSSSAVVNTATGGTSSPVVANTATGTGSVATHAPLMGGDIPKGTLQDFVAVYTFLVLGIYGAVYFTMQIV